MPIDVAPEQDQLNDDDLMMAAMRGAMPMRTGEATSGGPMPQPVGARPAPAALSGDNLMKMAMSSGMKVAPTNNVQPAPAAPNIPAGDTPPSALSNALDKSTQMPAAPPRPQDTLGPMIQQRAEAGQPIDRSDPKYRVGFGGRLARGAAAILSGGVPNLLRSAFDPSRATFFGKGAVNSKYEADTERQAADLKNRDVQIAGTEKLNTENESLYRDAIRQAYESQVGQARQRTSAAQQQAAEARTMAATAQEETAKTRAQAEAAKEGQRDIAYDPKTKRFTQGGKTYVPKSIEEGASLEAANGVKGRYSEMWGAERRNSPAMPRQPTDLEMWRDAFKRDNGREPNAQEIADRKYHPKSAASNAGRVSSAQKDKETELAAAEKQFGKEWNQAYKDGDTDPATLKEIKDRHEQNKARILKAFDDRMAVLDPDGSLQVGAQPAAKPATAAATAPASAPQRKVGDIVPTKNGNMKITKILPNGKFEGVSAGQ